MADIMEKLIEEKVERMNEQIEEEHGEHQMEEEQAQEAQEMTEQRVVMYKEIITFNCILLMKKVMMEHVQFEERVSMMVEVVCRIRQILILYENHKDILCNTSIQQYDGMVKMLIMKVKQINEVIKQKEQEQEKEEEEKEEKEEEEGKKEGTILNTSVHNAFLEVHEEIMSAYEPFNEQPVFK